MSTRNRNLAVIAAAVVGISVLVAVRVVREGNSYDAGVAESFFERYVDDTGRVIRHDQGGDTVSEGQAYAMLLAAAIRDEERFDRVWSWTRDNLQREDGTLSWQWANGAVTDAEPAADADVDAAYALLIAADRFKRDSYLDDARKIADGILAVETRDDVLVAGSWAVDRGVLNPSYFDPRAFRRFARAFDEPRWSELASSSYAITRALTSEGTEAPPDWARIVDGRTAAISGPDATTGPGRYGLDAPRLLIRFAVGNAQERALVAKLAGVVERDASHPLHHAAVAAALRAGERDDDRVLQTVVDDAREDPSYYGDAWAALIGAWLDERALV